MLPAVQAAALIAALVPQTSCANACARAPWLGGVNGAWLVTTVVRVVAVCAWCCGRPTSRTGWPTPFGSADGSCPTMVSEVGTGRLLVSVRVRAVVLKPVVLGDYGTRF